MVAPGAMLDVFAAHPDAAALLLDYDGVLAPIVVDPATAQAPDETLSVLGRLADRLLLVGVVSGRPIDFLVGALPLEGIELVGQYGLERRVAGRTVVEPAALAFRDAIAQAAIEAELRWPDLLIERKGDVAVTVHWRGASDRGESVAGEVAELASELGLAVHPTRMARELRPPISVDKGSGVRALLRDAPAATIAAFAGDDRGDLPALDALDELQAEGRLSTTVRIAVRSSEVPAELLERADFIVDGPRDLLDWLRALADALDSRRP